MRELLGPEVATLLEGVQRLGRMRWDRIEEQAAESLRKMFLAMAHDVRVVLVVLAMRVQMMRALRDKRAAQSRRAGTVTGRAAARAVRDSLTNVPCPTCARASPEATSSS